MAIHLPFQALTPEQLEKCTKMISGPATYMMVVDSIVRGLPTSIVRMGDGEKRLYECGSVYTKGEKVMKPHSPFSDVWLKDMGCIGMRWDDLRNRLLIAAMECTYFAPNSMGILMPDFNVMDCFPGRGRYVDCWYVRTWTRELQISLLKGAGHVLYIGNDKMASRFLPRANSYGIKLDYFRMNDWADGDLAIRYAKENTAPLVLFSGGPANKYIGPIIANNPNQNKTVLDIGSAIYREWSQ